MSSNSPHLSPKLKDLILIRNIAKAYQQQSSLSTHWKKGLGVSDLFMISCVKIKKGTVSIFTKKWRCNKKINFWKMIWIDFFSVSRKTIDGECAKKYDHASQVFIKGSGSLDMSHFNKYKYNIIRRGTKKKSNSWSKRLQKL